MIKEIIIHDQNNANKVVHFLIFDSANHVMAKSNLSAKERIKIEVLGYVAQIVFYDNGYQ